jgi:hypothetical protein
MTSVARLFSHVAQQSVGDGREKRSSVRNAADSAMRTEVDIKRPAGLSPKIAITTGCGVFAEIGRSRFGGGGTRTSAGQAARSSDT